MVLASNVHVKTHSAPPPPLKKKANERTCDSSFFLIQQKKIDISTFNGNFIIQ